jgi:hypothetical protein
VEIIGVHTPEQLEQLKALFMEYFEYLRAEHGIDPGYRGRQGIEMGERWAVGG